MKLEGIHHITAITGDAPRNVDFYVRVLGLRLVKKTVNQDDPTVYHLFYADEKGSAGTDLTFFEYPHAMRGSAGAGMVHRVVWRVGSVEALDFWAGRLSAEGHEVARDGDQVRFADPEGLDHELLVYDGPDAPLMADAPDVPAEMALQGFDTVRAYTRDPAAQRAPPGRGHGPPACGRRHVGGAPATSATARSPTTRRPRHRAGPARAPCTTSRGRPRSTSTRHGATASSRPACTRRP